MKHGIYIGIYPNNSRYLLELCTTNNFQEQQEEAKNFSIRTGVDKVYWFQSFPFSLDDNEKEAAEYAIKNGYLVYSEQKD